MEDIDKDVSSVEDVNNKRGGARPGAGRKKVYKSSYDFKRLKCKRELADLARTCISVLDSLSEKERNAISATNMDGSVSDYKGNSSKYWTEHDSFSSSWSIRINGETDFRIFALAYLLDSPQHIIIEWFNHTMQNVHLRWRSVNEIGRLMITYGNLMARKNRLKTSEQELLDKIPESPIDIYDFLSSSL